MGTFKQARLLLIGFGHAGHKITEILANEYNDFVNLPTDSLKAVGIFTKSRGSVVNADGINLAAALEEFRANGAFSANYHDYVDYAVLDAIQKLDYDILVELSTLSITGCGEPAVSYIRKALRRKKDVVTANKGPLAFAYQELRDLAIGNRCEFRFQSTVMDGVPVFSPFLTDIPGCRILSISGILNSTTNFIINSLEAGHTMEQAIAIAQKKGFAEADPAHDIDGWDGAAKICVLVRILMNEAVNPFDVERESLVSVDLQDYQISLPAAHKLKYICRADREGETIKARVRPELVPVNSLFASIKDTGNALKIETDGMAPIYITQEAPTLYDTAFGVLNDIVAIMRK